MGDHAGPFKQGKMFIDMQMNLLDVEEADELLTQLSNLLDEIHGKEE